MTHKKQRADVPAVYKPILWDVQLPRPRTDGQLVLHQNLMRALYRIESIRRWKAGRKISPESLICLIKQNE